jgi:hypothetical protein
VDAVGIADRIARGEIGIGPLGCEHRPFSDSLLQRLESSIVVAEQHMDASGRFSKGSQ